MAHPATLRELGVKIVVFLLVALGFFLICWTVYVFCTVSRGMVIHKLDTETARLASTLFFDKMTALAQLSIGLLGGAWAFITLVDTQVKVERWPAITCFTMANFSFLFSVIVYAYGYDFIVARIFHHATFDIDAPFINVIRKSQQFLFINGCFDLGFTILFGRRN